MDIAYYLFCQAIFLFQLIIAHCCQGGGHGAYRIDILKGDIPEKNFSQSLMRLQTGASSKKVAKYSALIPVNGKKLPSKKRLCLLKDCRDAPCRNVVWQNVPCQVFFSTYTDTAHFTGLRFGTGRPGKL